MKNTIFIILLLLLNNFCAIAQSELTVENLDNPSPGYLLLDSHELGYLTLIDNSGFVAYKKKLESNDAAKNFNVMQAGLFTFNSNKKFHAINQSLAVIDSFSCKNGLITDFHDIKLTSSGHVYLLGVSYDTVDMSVLVQGGKPNAALLSFVIQEQDENKNVVWEWRALDHFKVTDATSEVDLTQQSIDWVHTNWMTFDSDGNLIISNRHLDEITKINRQTGDIIWRLGGKKCKNNQFTFLNDTIDGFWGFSHQHCVQKLPNGNLLLFDNGNLKPTQYSRAVEYEIDEVNKTIRKVWEYNGPRDFFSKEQGSVQRLPNGNTIIGWGTNNTQMTLSEVVPDGSLAMEARNFKSYLALRYPIYMASKLLLVREPGDYNFSDLLNKTAVSLKIGSLSDSGYVSVERHYYTPHYPSFEEYFPFNIYGNRWVLNNKNIKPFSGTIVFNLSEIDSLDSPEKMKIYWRKQEGNGIFTRLETSYDKSMGTLEANISSFGEFIIAEPELYPPLFLVNPIDSSKNNPLILDLKWYKVKNADSYRIQVSDDSNFNFNLIDTIVVADTLLQCQNLETNKIYFWRIKSKFDSNESRWSKTWNFTTQLNSASLTYPADKEINFPVRGIFKWDTVAGAINYIINISKTFDFDSLVVDESGLVNTSFSTVSLLYNTKYFWRIKAFSPDNEGPWSETRSFTTEEKKVLNIPVLLSPQNDTSDVPLYGFLYWNPVINAESYNLEVSLFSDFHKNIISNIDIGSTSLYYSGLYYNTIHYWHVMAENQYDTSSWSDTWNFRTQKIEDVIDGNNNSFFIIKDNEGNLIIHTDYYFENLGFTLFDYTGRVILNEKLMHINNVININQLDKGIYFYLIKLNSKIINGKILIY